MQTVFHRASSRGYAKHSWLETYHSFSFAGYFDPKRMGFGALRVINDDLIAPATGFGKHAHDNMEIITIPLSGALTHEDSLGNKETIETGEIQVMSAGTGVEHAEFNASETKSVSLLQIWILPNELYVAPRYDQKRFDSSVYTNKLETVVGEVGKAPLGIHQRALLSLGRFDEEQEFTYSPVSREQGVYFFVIEGKVKIADVNLQKRDALGVWEADTFSVQVEKGAFLLAIEVPMK